MTKNKLSVFIILACLFFGCKNDEPDTGSLDLLQIVIGSTEIDLNGTSENLPIDRNISVIFSNPLDQSSVINSITLSNGTENVNINLSFSSQDKNVIISPIGALSNNVVYTLRLSDQLQGANGQRFENLEVNFKTVLGDLTLLSVRIAGADVTNEAVATNVPLNLEMIFDFSAPVNVNSFENAIELSGPDVPGLNISLSNNDQTVKASWQDELDYLAKYEFTLSDLLKGSEGGQFTGYALTIHTDIDPSPKFPVISEEELLTLVQQQTFKYFWDFGHPVSGLARERNTSG